MTGEKKSHDLSSRLTPRRSKNAATRPSKSPTSAISAPPKAAIATAKRFNDMLHPRSSKERERIRKISDETTSRDDSTGIVAVSLEEERPSGDGERDTEPAQRIADLERALATAREEQNAMREELVKLREHGQMYGETIEDYRGQLADPYQSQNLPATYHSGSRPTSARSNSYEGELNPRISLNQPRGDLSDQNDDLRAKVAQLQDQLMTQQETYQHILEDGRSRSGSEWEKLTARLHATEKESQERLQQLLSLKSAVSNLTRVESQVTDSELSETFSQLSNRVREWVISNFRRTKLDFTNISQGTAKVLEIVSPTYRNTPPADRLALLQALISTTMMPIFHEPIFVGLPETGPLATLHHLGGLIQDTGNEFVAWRNATVRGLQKSGVQRELQEEKEKLIHRLASEILHHLIAVTSATLPSDAQPTLESILHATADFTNTLLSQKAQFQVRFFWKQDGSGQKFDEERMEPINELDDDVDEDGDIAVDRVFAFCVFPCLEKFGDEYGEHAEVCNVLARARVCCSVG